ncbi:uncharacterized protein METZ01_LOCUS506962, partial [marine metagenome]
PATPVSAKDAKSSDAIATPSGYGVWRPIHDNPFFQDRLRSNIISLKHEYCLSRKLKDGVYHIKENARTHRIGGGPWSGGLQPVPIDPRWHPNYKIPYEYKTIYYGRPCLKYELNGKQYVRHFYGLRSLEARKGEGLGDVVAVAEDLVKKQGCRHISLVFEDYRDEVTLVDDWRYFTVPPKYRPLDIKEFKRQIFEDKMDIFSRFSGILHKMPLGKLRMFLEEPAMIAKTVPV